MPALLYIKGRRTLMKHFVLFSLCCSALMSVLSCSAPNSIASYSEEIEASLEYPLRISFVADYTVPLPVHGWATQYQAGFWPRSFGRIDNKGEGFYLTLEGNAINAVLPYYGQRDLFRSIHDTPGIVLTDKTLEKFSYQRSADHRILALEFQTRQHTERFELQLIILRNKKAYLSISSPQRRTVLYQGRVESL